MINVLAPRTNPAGVWERYCDTGANTTTTLGYDVAHELTSFGKKIGTTTTGNLTLSCNNNGDRISQTAGSGTTSFTHDQADRLTKYAKGTTTATYAYDGTGLRASKTVGSTTTAEVWDAAAGLPLLLQDGSTNYVTGPDCLPLEQVNGNKPYYYYQDQLDSTRATLDSRASTVATYTYDPYGNRTSSTGSVSNAGQHHDSEPGLYCLRAPLLRSEYRAVHQCRSAGRRHVTALRLCG